MGGTHFKFLFLQKEQFERYCWHRLRYFGCGEGVLVRFIAFSMVAEPIMEIAFRFPQPSPRGNFGAFKRS